MEPDFVFDAENEPSLEQLKEMYGIVLGGAKKKPHVAFEPATAPKTRAEAEQWLRSQHARYVATLPVVGGKSRSHVLTNMKLEERVELMGYDG